MATIDDNIQFFQLEETGISKKDFERTMNFITQHKEMMKLITPYVEMIKLYDETRVLIDQYKEMMKLIAPYFEMMELIDQYKEIKKLYETNETIEISTSTRTYL